VFKKTKDAAAIYVTFTID